MSECPQLRIAKLLQHGCENLTCGCIPDCGVALFENACTRLLETPIQCESSTATPSISTVSNSSGSSRHQTTSNPVAFTTGQEYEKTTIDPFGFLVHRSGLYIGYGLSGLLFSVVSVTWLCRGCRLLQKSCERRRLMKNRVNVICVEEANPREYNPYQSNYPPANPYGGGYTSYGYGGGYGNPYQQNPAAQMVRE
uniref:Uncharacterized protein n=1 Tax=Magallana gigas TaxID=29159 RepID=K1QLZ5_MAGGI